MGDVANQNEPRNAYIGYNSDAEKGRRKQSYKFTKDSKVSFVGTLNNYGGAILPMSLDDGEIK